MTPAQAIAALDRQLSAHGQTVTIRRTVPNGPAVEVTVRAFVRGYKPAELTDGITVGSSSVVVSPSSLKASPFFGDGNLPRKNDAVVISGRKRNIEAVEAVKLDDVLVRVNLQVAG